MSDALTKLRDELTTWHDVPIRERFLALIDQAIAERAWQPIETAPKMRTILLFAITDPALPNYKMATGHWSTAHETWIWDGQEVKVYECQPTHWMTLPEPPK